MSRTARRPPSSDDREWQGEYVRYDLVKEFVVALAVITALIVVLAVLFSSPDDKPMTIQQWARADPADFVATAVTELDGTQRDRHLRPALQRHPGRRPEGPRGQHRRRWPGVALPDRHGAGLRARSAAETFPATRGSSRRWPRTRPLRRACRQRWTDAYTAGARRRPATRAGSRSLPPGRYGPVAPMMALAGRPRAERRARRRPADVEPVLPDELHQAAAVPLRRRLLRDHAPRRSTCSATSGE